MKLEQTGKQKRQYEKPRLRCIELVTEEVLGSGCKFINGPANFGIPMNCGLSNNCVLTGS